MRHSIKEKEKGGKARKGEAGRLCKSGARRGKKRYMNLMSFYCAKMCLRGGERRGLKGFFI